MGAERLEIEQLTRAVERRTTIGIALGILMERCDLEHEQAFDYLRQCSQHQNRKLYDIAAELAETRRLPQIHPSRESA